MRIALSLMTAIVLGAASPAVFAQAVAEIETTPLDDYLAKPDDVFKWEVVATGGNNRSKSAVIRLVSQTWLTENEVDRPVWEHWVTVVKPEKVTTDVAFLVVSGGSNDRPAPSASNEVVTRIAEATGSIVAEIKMVPNQPLIFHGDGQPRKEDDLIGYAWNQFLETGDAEWLPRLPMVKSVVRAMDCLQEWSEDEGARIEKFVVSGASKRGWTTWMVGATDPRVAAIVPIVIDVLNVQPNMLHHAAVYGFWSEAVGNYYQHNILQRPLHPRMAELHRIEDPYYYRERLTMPKYIINASGDQFFCPDSSRFYYDDLVGEKHIRYVPNTDHGVDGSIDAITSLVAFYQMVIDGRERPELSWTFEDDGSIHLTPSTPPRKMVLWQATNPTARDFRVDTIGKAYTATEVTPDADGAWIARPATPAQGWTAAFVEATFDSGGAFAFKESTAVRILPDTCPYEGIDPSTVKYEPDLKRAAAGGE